MTNPSIWLKPLPQNYIVHFQDKMWLVQLVMVLNVWFLIVTYLWHTAPLELMRVYFFKTETYMYVYVYICMYVCIIIVTLSLISILKRVFKFDFFRSNHKIRSKPSLEWTVFLGWLFVFFFSAAVSWGNPGGVSVYPGEERHARIWPGGSRQRGQSHISHGEFRFALTSQSRYLHEVPRGFIPSWVLQRTFFTRPVKIHYNELLCRGHFQLKCMC